MKDVKNYGVNFISNDTIWVSMEQAEGIIEAMYVGGIIMVEGNIYQTHQITSLVRSKEVERRFINKLAEDKIQSIYRKQNSDFCTKEEWGKMSDYEKGKISIKTQSKNRILEDERNKNLLIQIEKESKIFESQLVIKEIKAFRSNNNTKAIELL